MRISFVLYAMCVGLGVASVCALADGDKKPGVSLKWSGYCSPVVATCKNKERVFGRAEPRLQRTKIFCSPCYFTPPKDFEGKSLNEWAAAACKDKGGVESKIKQPKYHVDINTLLEDAAAISVKSGKADNQWLGLLQAIFEAKWDKQQKYDAYVQATYGGYGVPVVEPKDAVKKAKTEEEKAVAVVQEKELLNPLAEEQCVKLPEAKMEESAQILATCPVEPSPEASLAICPPPPPPLSENKEAASKKLEEIKKKNMEKSELNKEDVSLSSQDLFAQIRAGKTLKKVTDEKKRTVPVKGDDLQSSLFEALENRRKKMKLDESPAGYGPLKQQVEESSWED